MTKRQDLYLQRRSRPEQSDQRQPDAPLSPSFRPLVSEIDIRWSAGRPAASRLYDALLAESRDAGQRYIASDGIVDAVRNWRRAAPDS
jgi:hypothetical protein